MILIRLVGFVPFHICTGDEKDCLYIKYVDLGKRWALTGLSAADGDMSVEERDIKSVFIYRQQVNGKYKILKKFARKRGISARTLIPIVLTTNSMNLRKISIWSEFLGFGFGFFFVLFFSSDHFQARFLKSSEWHILQFSKIVISSLFLMDDTVSCYWWSHPVGYRMFPCSHCGMYTRGMWKGVLTSESVTVRSTLKPAIIFYIYN